MARTSAPGQAAIMAMCATFVGFGEAGQAFATSGDRAFDIKTDHTATRAAKLADYAGAQVCGCVSLPEALTGAPVLLSLVTASQALDAARDAAAGIDRGALWLDMNSVAPATKRAAAMVLERAGGRYVDVAVMSPVLPGRRAAPLLVAGPHADDAAATLREIGFTNVTIAGPQVGDSSAIKMIRSVMVKGLEALSAECAQAAHAAGVSASVLASLDASWKPGAWADRIDYNLERMMLHGLRRAAEMEEVVRTLEDLGVDPVMTRGTVARQRAIGMVGVTPPAGLAAKLNALTVDREDEAA